MFRLSFSRIALWCGSLLLLCMLLALTVSLVLGLLVFLLARLPFELIVSPIMLGVLPVLLITGLFIPIILLISLLFSGLLRYELNDMGIVQYFGPIKNEVDWLEIQSAEMVQPVTFPRPLTLFHLHCLKKERPMTLYTGFFSEPDAFFVSLDALAPKEHPVRTLLSTLVEES